MNSLELRQKRGALVAQMNSLLDGKWDSDVQEKWEKINVEQEALRVRIEALEKTDNVASDLRRFTPPPQGQPGEWGPAENRIARGANRILEIRSSREYSDAFDDYCRHGRANALMEELRSTPLTETTTGGGYLIPVGFQRELEIKLKAIGPMRGACRIITTATGNTLQWPTWDDTSNVGEWLVINSDATASANPTFGQVNFISNVASSKQVLIPVQLLQDSAFDLQAELSDAFAIRIGRLINTGYTTGTGTTMPNGVVPGVPAGNIISAKGDIQSGNTDLNSVGVDDLANLISALDPAYRLNAKFMANQSTFDAMRKLKDSLGRPLWVASITQGEPDRIFGYPFFFNQMMAAVGAGNKSIVFGDFSKYLIRDVLGVTFVRFNELYMGSYQVGFQAYLRTDGQVLQPAAFSALYHPLS